MPKRFYGQRPDSTKKFDNVKYSLLEHLSHAFSLTKNLSYASWGGNVYDQGQYGTCTCNCLGRFFEIVALKHHSDFISPSRSAWYAQAQRQLYTPPGQEPQDGGLETADPLKMWLEHGYQLEVERPYPQLDGSELDKLLAPCDPKLWKKDYQVISFARVPATVLDIKKAMYSKGPTLFGGPFATEWEQNTNRDGSLPTPVSIGGGHCFLGEGYSDTVKLVNDSDGTKRTGAFLCPNSWGKDWGFKPVGAYSGGYFWYPYDYFTIANGQFAIQDVYTAVAP